MKICVCLSLALQVSKLKSHVDLHVCVRQRMSPEPSVLRVSYNIGVSILRQDPLENILDIFGRIFLNYFFESSWKNVRNDTTFVRMRSGDLLRDEKMSKKGTSLRQV